MSRPDLSKIVVLSCLAVVAVATSALLAPNAPRAAMGAALGLLMLAIAAVDAHRFIIPNALTAVALALALANAALDEEGAAAAVLAALVRGAVLALSFLAVRTVYYRLRHRHGIGLGDVKLAAVAGAWLEWSSIPIAVEIAALSALAVYALGRLRKGRPLSATAILPFGLFFAPAIWIGWLLEILLQVP